MGHSCVTVFQQPRQGSDTVDLHQKAPGQRCYSADGAPNESPFASTEVRQHGGQHKENQPRCPRDKLSRPARHNARKLENRPCQTQRHAQVPANVAQPVGKRLVHAWILQLGPL